VVSCSPPVAKGDDALPLAQSLGRLDRMGWIPEEAAGASFFPFFFFSFSGTKYLIHNFRSLVAIVWRSLLWRSLALSMTMLLLSDADTRIYKS